MDDFIRFDDAFGRLSAALERLEAASARRLRSEGRRGDLEEELAVLQDDRSRLAVELDAALARAASVESAAEEVARKVKSAGAAIREIVAAADAQGA